jgi:hypothetical protein
MAGVLAPGPPILVIHTVTGFMTVRTLLIRDFVAVTLVIAANNFEKGGREMD